MDLFHLVMSTVGREPLLLEPRQRRAALRTLARVGGPSLWLFAFADDHLHALVDTPRPTLLGGHLALAFRALPGAVEMQPAWAEPVDGREHLRRLVPYVLRQSEHHGLGPAAEWEGSCFLDLVGARRLAGFDPAAWRAGLPREDLGIVWRAVDLDRPPGVGVTGLPIAAILAASSRATGARPDLAGRTPDVVRARRVAIALAREAGFTAGQIAAALGCTPHGVRLLVGTVDEDDLLAARRGLAIDAAVARRAARAA